MKQKKHYRGTFNFSGQPLIYYCRAFSSAQAKRLFMMRIVKDSGQILRAVTDRFNGQVDNFKIEEV